MKLDDYQERALASAIYPERTTGSKIAIVYCALGLAEEAGESAGKIKKMLRDNDGVLDDDIRHRLSRELGDVLWYLAALAREIGLKLSDVAETNLDKTKDRLTRGMIRGSGDDR